MRYARWGAEAVSWAADGAAIKTGVATGIAVVLSVVAWLTVGERAVYGVFVAYGIVLCLLGFAWWRRRDMVDGILFTARYRPLPLTFRYLSEDLQDGPNRHDTWEDRPSLVSLKLYVSRKRGLQNCYLTLKNAGHAQRSLLIKGSLGVNTMSRQPSKTSDWFEPRLFIGDVGRSLNRVYFLLIDVRLPSNGQRLGWVIESDNAAVLSGDVPLKRESRVGGVWRALTKPEDVGFPHL